MSSFGENFANDLSMLESPFLDSPVTREAEERDGHRELESSLWELDTPFQHDSFGAEASTSPLQAELSKLLSELKDEAFAEAMQSMAAEAMITRVMPLSAELQETEAGIAQSEQMLSEHFGPLATAAEQMLEQMSEAFSRYDMSSMTEAEVDRVAEQFMPQPAAMSPVQEQFLSGLWRKAKKLAKGAIALVGKGVGGLARVGLGPLLKKLKLFVWPLVRQVAKFAIGKLPLSVQPLARKLASKLSLKEAGPMDESFTGQVLEATPSFEAVQFEFDVQAAQLLFASDEAEMQQFAEESAGQTQYEDPAGDLHRAREKLIAELGALNEGESAGRAIQNFLPAALLALRPVAKVALGVVGRQRVVDFLAKLLARLIQRFVGREGALALSRATVDVGLGALGLEAPERSERLGYETVATTLEQTLVGLLERPSYVFEQEQLLEAAAMESFEAAVQANVPNQMLKPEHQVAGPDTAGSFVLMPRRPGRKYYKKYTVVRDVTIQRPAVAASIKTFGQATLEDFFSEQLLLPPNKPVKARLHVYEAICGSWLGYVSQMESSVGGLGNYSRDTYFQFHPLTGEAALALNVAGLGRDVPPAYLAGREALAMGQRVYYLELPGRRGVVVPAGSYVRVEIDLRAGEIRIYVYISEKRSQEIAKELQTGGATQGAVRTVQEVLRAFVNTVRGRRAGSAVKVIRETLEMEQFTMPSFGSVVQSAKSAASAVASAVGNAVPSIGGGLIRDAVAAPLKGATAGLAEGGPAGMVAEAVLNYLIDKVIAMVDIAIGGWLVNNKALFIRQANDPSKKGVTIMLAYSVNPSLLGTWLRTISPISALTPTRIELHAGPR